MSSGAPSEPDREPPRPCPRPPRGNTAQRPCEGPSLGCRSRGCQFSPLRLRAEATSSHLPSTHQICRINPPLVVKGEPGNRTGSQDARNTAFSDSWLRINLYSTSFQTAFTSSTSAFQPCFERTNRSSTLQAVMLSRAAETSPFQHNGSPLDLALDQVEDHGLDSDDTNTKAWPLHAFPPNKIATPEIGRKGFWRFTLHSLDATR
ncbi:uncharacterized protein B0I36DRAFT_65305 [Microdochium trichocladiopsis]|uniref:Uncharacterized protein n=1 Tax=Microdochium trichocladiopsis TaxID=1682393 RepID=A0A9P8YEF9_9PEZI|nr:uncharacterized protein B0I36DRAFT_65305 [Microdochium trichocladiopsis]KAH7037387.1 hypothetical protein B0I36DRAFT_65305 [Microdochium trichocladiopsis]